MHTIRASLIIFPCVVWVGPGSMHVHAQKVSVAPLARPYLLRLADGVAACRNHLPSFADSAKRAAEGTIAGGNLYAYGPQPSFVSEATGRAGGLMLTRPFSTDVTLTSHDTILAALTGTESKAQQDALRSLVDQANNAGAQVVLFDTASSATLNADSVVNLPREQVVSHADRELASVSNVVAMWAWTGRFIAACTSNGKMPCVYESHLLPEARQRTERLHKFDGGRFHLVSAVRPKDAEPIAETYLATIEQRLRQMSTTELSDLERAASLIRNAHRRGNQVAVYTLGHMFPGEFQLPHQPDWIVHADALQPGGGVDAAIVLYHMSFPRNIVDNIRGANQACIVVCAESAPADFTADSRNIYLNPHWPAQDAIVKLSNYDVDVLPASGVMNAALYWQLIQWATADTKTVNRTGIIPPGQAN